MRHRYPACGAFTASFGGVRAERDLVAWSWSRPFASRPRRRRPVRLNEFLGQSRSTVAVKLLTILAVVVAAAAWSGTGAATIVVKHDAAGRPITFEVLAPGVDADWYASVLSRAAHGDEIATVTIRIVPGDEIDDRCGHAAAACYSGGRAAVVTVPAGRSAAVAAILLHEYAPHLDRAWPVDGVPEPNGTPVWWSLRAMDELRRTAAVARDYSLGWDRGIGEIFAEDYAYAELGDAYGIHWLYPPTPALKKALLAELRGEST